MDLEPRIVDRGPRIGVTDPVSCFRMDCSEEPELGLTSLGNWIEGYLFG